MSNSQDHHCKMEIPGPLSLFLHFNYLHSLTLAVHGRKSQMLSDGWWWACKKPKLDQIHGQLWRGCSHKAPKAFVSYWILLSTSGSHACNGSYHALFWTSEFLFITSVFTPCLLCNARRFNSSMGTCSGMKALRWIDHSLDVFKITPLRNYSKLWKAERSITRENWQFQKIQRSEAS